MISHWDELPWQRMERGHIAGDRLNPTGDSSVTTRVVPLDHWEGED